MRLILASSLSPGGTSVLDGDHKVRSRGRLQAASHRVQVARDRLAVLRTKQTAAIVAKTSTHWATEAVTLSWQETDSVTAQAVHVASTGAGHAVVDALRSIHAAAHIWD